MAVRKTESLLPPGFSASDLGQSATSATSTNVILISFLSSPVAARRIQHYVVFVTDNALAATVNSYEWNFTNGPAVTQSSINGIAEFTPQNIGTLTVTVNLKSASNATLHSVTLTQQVISLNEALELKIEQTENNFPGAAHPETSRELINDIRPYINVILPVASNDLYNKAISSLAYIRALATIQTRRNVLLEDLANILNTRPGDFFSQSKDGFGICKTRPQLLAMFLDNPSSPGNKYLDAAALELRSGANSTQRTANETAIQTAFTALNVDVQTSLFNLLRFPKSHLAMAKLILDGLESRYYSSASIGATLANNNDAKRLITEYEKGLIAFGSGSNPLTTTRFSSSVANMFNHQVWTIPVTPISGAPAAGGVPGVTTPATVGIPEKLPSLTFIAHSDTEAGFGASSVGFLRKAFLYHDSFALNPQVARSFEDLVDQLSGAATPIDRLRLVTHFGAPAGATTLTGIGTMFLPFFTGQTQNNGSGNAHNQTYAEHFQFAISDDEGIKAMFEKFYFPSFQPDFLSSLTMNTHTDTVRRPFYTAIFRFLQASHHASLVPFGLDQTGSPSPSVLTIMKWAADLFFLNNGDVQVQATDPAVVAPQNIPALVKTAFADFVNNKLAALATDTGPATLPNIIALANAFSAQTFTTLNAASFNNSITYTLSSVYLDNHNSFRAKLATVRSRLDNSFVDIRGCRVGQDRNFMQKVRGFFGNAATAPMVSAPEWFQEMGNIGFVSGNVESLMDGCFNSGVSGTRISGTDVQREYSAWSGRVGINSQVSFWTTLFNGDTFDVISLTWKNLLPPIGMTSALLDALSTQNYPDTISTLKSIFHLDPTSAPTAADCTTFHTNSFPSLTNLLTIQTAVTPLTDSSPQPDLQTQLTALTSLASTLSVTLPVAPAPITKRHLEDCITAIKQKLVSLSGITPMVTSIKARLSDTKAGYRYMLDIGLPIILQSASHEDDTRLIYYSGHQTNALKSFKKIQFEGPLPAATLTAIDSINPTGSNALDTQGTTDPNDDTFTDLGKGLAYSRLAIDHQDSQTAVNPSEEFHEHIKTEP